ncbi:hypothetical protein Leryth_013756 [Lithospermum erythrorhizon]|nr:hypothetical protein Leryth_013756 [Lithospermum erythrorhizon]
MATRQKDLECAEEVIVSQTLNLHSISFHLSEPTSICYQETENSMHLNISKQDLSHFSRLVSLLLTIKMECLRNLEFHNVEWELKQVKNLGGVLENNSSIKQLVFRRNIFDVECLSELSDMLKNNVEIKEIMLSESSIGSVGASLLASALKVNTSLEELQIWEDSIGSKGAEELSKMIEVNSTLKLLIVFDSKTFTASPLISAVLARNRSMEVHIWSGNVNQASYKVVEFVPDNSTLRLYQADISGACRISVALGWNSTVRSLDLTGIRLKSRWARDFRWVLEQNRTLKEVNLSKTCLKDKGVVYVAAGLFKNRSLERLNLHGNCFGGVGIEHLLCPLSRFSSLQFQANTTLKSVTFGGRKTKIGRDGLASIMQMLTTNETLTSLGVYDDESLRPQDVMKIFKCLERNASLRRLSLQGCKGVQGEIVLQSIEETLQINPWIEEIDLARTPLQNAGKTEKIYQRLGQSEEIEPEIDMLKDMNMTEPKSCRNIPTQKLAYSDHVRTLVKPVEQAITTVGLKIRNIEDEGIKLSIWNLAGQHEFYALHDLMFPGHGSASCFFVVSSLYRKPSNKELKTPIEVEEDIHYWLRFIVSNSKRAVQQCMLPNVTVVLTHFDKVNQQSQEFIAIVGAIQRLRDKFQSYIEFYPTVFTVDARSTASVSKLTQHLRKTSKTILERVPRVYELCNDLIQILSDWRSENQNKTAMKWKEFRELCQIKVPMLRIRSRLDNKEKVEMRRKAIATCLHHIGEVIYFVELEFLILDCEWFCCEVLNPMIKLDVRKQKATETEGFIMTKELERSLRGSMQSQIFGTGSKVFDNLEVDDLVKMMMKLELCYEQDPSNPNSPLLIPSILEDGRGKTQRWPVNTSDCVYAGRHLECDDSSHMFLTPGFFPRLQVHLYNKIKELKNQHGATYSLEKYLISICINGIYVRIELGGQLGHYLDVLACSTNNLTETLRLFKQLIIPAIQNLCQGVSLNENVLRYHDLYNLAVELQVPMGNNTDALEHHSSTSEETTIDPTFAGIAKGVEIVLQRLKIIEQELKDIKQEIQGLRYYEHKLLTELHQKVNYLVNYNIQVEERKVPNMFYFVKTENYSRRLVTTMLSGMAALRLHMLCEFRGEMHVVEDQIGCEVMQVDNKAVIYLAPYMKKFMKLLTFALKIGAHLVAGMGEMIPDLSREVAHLAHSPLVYGAAGAAAAGVLGVAGAGAATTGVLGAAGAGAAAAGVLGVAAVGRGAVQDRSVGSRDFQQDLRAAQQWVLDYLREKRCSSGKDIAEKFDLLRVRYYDNGQIAWICRRHMYTRRNEIVEVPL